MSYETGFIEKCAQYGIDPAYLIKEAARGDYLRKALSQLEDVVARAGTKELPKTGLQDVDHLSRLLSRSKDKLGIEYAPTLRPTQHGGPHAWQVNPYPFHTAGAPPRQSVADFEKAVADMRGAGANVKDIRKQWFRKLVDPDYHTNMNAAVDASRLAERNFSKAVDVKNSVERAAAVARELRSEMPRMRAVGSMMKQSNVLGHDYGAFQNWKQRTGYQPQSFWERLGGVFGVKPQDFYQSPEYGSYRLNRPKNWALQRNAVGPSFNEMARTGPWGSSADSEFLGRGMPFDSKTPNMGGISGSNNPLSMSMSGMSKESSVPKNMARIEHLTKEASRGEQFMNAIENLRKFPGFSTDFLGATGQTAKEIEDIVTADKDLAHKMMKPFNLGKGTTSYPPIEDNPEMVKFYAKALKAMKKKLAGKESPYEVVPRVRFWRDDL